MDHDASRADDRMSANGYVADNNSVGADLDVILDYGTTAAWVLVSYSNAVSKRHSLADNGMVVDDQSKPMIYAEPTTHTCLWAQLESENHLGEKSIGNSSHRGAEFPRP